MSNLTQIPTIKKTTITTNLTPPSLSKTTTATTTTTTTIITNNSKIILKTLSNPITPMRDALFASMQANPSNALNVVLRFVRPVLRKLYIRTLKIVVHAVELNLIISQGRTMLHLRVLVESLT